MRPLHGEKAQQLNAQRPMLNGGGSPAPLTVATAASAVNSVGLNRADIQRSADYSPTGMNPQNIGGWLRFEKSTLLRRVRKIAIVLLLLGSFLPSLALPIIATLVVGVSLGLPIFLYMRQRVLDATTV